MIPTSFLYQLAEDEGIAVEWQDLHHIEGIYTYTPEMSRPVIILSSALHTQERRLRCVLAHELGHHFQTTGHYIIAANSTSSVYAVKNEHLATKWAVNQLIPTDDFLVCVKAGMDVHDLCNYFYVIPNYIIHKAELLHNDADILTALAELGTSNDVYI